MNLNYNLNLRWVLTPHWLGFARFPLSTPLHPHLSSACSLTVPVSILTPSLIPRWIIKKSWITKRTEVSLETTYHWCVIKNSEKKTVLSVRVLTQLNCFKIFHSEHLYLKKKLSTEFNCNSLSSFGGTSVKLNKKHVSCVRITNSTEFYKIIFKRKHLGHKNKVCTKFL